MFNTRKFKVLDIHISVLLSNENTFKLKKKVVALKTRFDKEERRLLKDFEVDQLLELATRLHVITQALQCPGPQTEIDKLLVDGDGIASIIEKFK
jgi:hypothetical protein